MSAKLLPMKAVLERLCLQDTVFKSSVFKHISKKMKSEETQLTKGNLIRVELSVQIRS